MISKFFYIAKTDLNGFLMGKIRKYRILVNRFISTQYTYLKIKFYRVHAGRRCKFYNTPIIYRAFNSKITIGSKCSFRSDKISNLIGLNRKCIITTLKENAIIDIGDNSGFSGTVIAAATSIIIGKNVRCGGNVTITDFDWHPIDPIARKTSGPIKKAPVMIGDNVWLGLNTIVLKGVTIGENTVIGANSVVVKDVPENVIAAGNPCKVIKRINDL